MLSKLSLRLKSNNFLNNLSLRLLSNVITSLLSLITLPIIARNLGPEYYGRWNVLLTIVNYISLPFTLGIIPYAIREMVKGQENVVSKILSVRLFILIFCFLIGFLICSIIYRYDFKMLISILILFIYLTSLALNTEYYFIASKNFKTPFFSQISGQLVFILLTVLLVKKESDFYYLALSFSLYHLTISVILLRAYLQNNKLKILLRIKDVIYVIRNSYKIGIGNLIENLNSTLPLMFLASMCEQKAIGLFSASFKIVSIIVLVIQTIMIVLAPRITEMQKMKGEDFEKRFNYISMILIVFGLVTSIVCFYLKEILIINLFGENYYNSIEYFKIFIFFYLPIVPLAMFLNNVLVYLEKDKAYMISTAISFLVSLLSTYTLVKLFGVKGSIYGIVISMCFYFIIPIYQINKHIKIIKR